MRKRKGTYWKWISTGPYDTDVLVVIGGEFREATSIFQEEKQEAGFEIPDCPWDLCDDSYSLGNFMSFTGFRDCGIWLPSIPESIQEIGTVAHESIHAVNHILARCGVHYTVDGSLNLESANDETWAYFTGYLVREVLMFADDIRVDLSKKKTKPKNHAKSKTSKEGA